MIRCCGCSGWPARRLISDVDATQDLFIRGVVPPLAAALVGAGTVVAFLLVLEPAAAVQLGQARVSARRIAAVLDAPDPVHDPAAPRTLPDGPLSVRLPGAQVRYPNGAAPTAHLDPGTRGAVLSDLLAPTAGPTVLLITHDLAGLDEFDEVLVLDGGKVVRLAGAGGPGGPPRCGAPPPACGRCSSGAS